MRIYSRLHLINSKIVIHNSLSELHFCPYSIWCFSSLSLSLFGYKRSYRYSQLITKHEKGLLSSRLLIDFQPASFSFSSLSVSSPLIASPPHPLSCHFPFPLSTCNRNCPCYLVLSTIDINQ